MSNEIFRFANLRRPYVNAQEPLDVRGIALQIPGEPTPLHTALRQLKETNQPRGKFEAVARKYLISDQYAFSSTPLSLSMNQLNDWLLAQGAQVSKKYILDNISTKVGETLEKLLKSERFRTTRIRLADSLLALNISSTSPTEKKLLARWIRIFGLLERLTAWPTDVIVMDRVLSIPILLPSDIFPLPPTKNPNDERIREAYQQKLERYTAAQQNARELANRIEQYRDTLSELTVALKADTNDMRRTTPINGDNQIPPVLDQGGTRSNLGTAAANTNGDSNSLEARRQIINPTQIPIPSSIVVLSSERAANLSATTKLTLQTFGISQDNVDVPYALTTIQTAISDVSSKLFRNRSYHTITRVGNQWIPDETSVLQDFGENLTPGPCLPQSPEDPFNSQPTVPASTMSTIRPIGIADLLQVRQNVKRYALGEIAHIENIMRAESKERTHRETTRVTETVVVETERTKEETRDLQTTERFELQREIDEVIRENNSREVGLSVSGSYGPFQGTATITVGHGDSREETNKNATRYSREVTDKAVKKVQERVLERRSTTTEQEVEEINKHGFDNHTGQQHIQGIYRWVDKIYEAQIVSYGLRMIFEFIVPEPAAFYKHASSIKPREWLKLECPNPPGYCHIDNDIFAPLLPSDINEGNYQFWLSQYGVTGTQPPPPLHKTIGIPLAAVQESSDSLTLVALANTEMQVPDGYTAERAYASGVFFDTPAKDFTNFHVGRCFLTMNSSGPMHGEIGTVPIVIHGNSWTGFAANIEVVCLRTQEEYASWQLSTYNAIMSAYNDLKSQYESALVRLETNVETGVIITGRNPALNRDLERTELKRASLSLLTAQHFDEFDAMRRDVPPHGYPQMDLREATAESGYIQFFEQAFEWSNISYLFYSYFWGRKSDWPAYLQLDDIDPLFAKFLQAGAARVQVPVCPGFEDAVLHLLETGNRPWEEEDNAFQIDGPLYRSMIAEIKEEQLGAFTKGVGTLSLKKDDTKVVGTDTAFDARLHTDREIIITERTYHVKQVISATELLLDQPYRDASGKNVSYSFGSRLVGDPWELRVPTSLVYLQSGNELPDLYNAG